MKRRAFLRGMLAASAAPYVVTADGALIPLQNGVKPIPFVHDIVQLGDFAKDGPNWLWSSRALRYEWTNPGGDYLDASGALNGTNHYASQTWPTSAGQTVQFMLPVALINKLLAENTGLFISKTGTQAAPRFGGRLGLEAAPPSLNIQTSSGSFDPPCIRSCFVDTTSALCLSETTHGNIRIQPAILKFDLSDVTGKVTSATLTLTPVTTFGAGLTVTVDYLRMPALIHDPARQLGGVRLGIAASVANDLGLENHPNVIFYPSFASLQAMEGSWLNVDGSKSWALPKTFVQWEEFGLPVVRIQSAHVGNLYGSTGTSLLTLHETIEGRYGNFTELYVRFLLMIDEDAFLAMNEPGVKLPGFSDQVGGVEFSYRTAYADHLTHADRASGQVAHPGVYRFSLHAYDATHTVSQFPSNAEPRYSSACLVAGRHYCIEQRVKLNTFTGATPNPDGITEMWIDGVKVYSDTRRVINDSEQPYYINEFFANIFHGGKTAPLAPFHVEFGGVVVSTKYIGPPKVVRRTVPAWVPPPGQVGVVPMANVFNDVNPCPAKDCIYTTNGYGGHGGMWAESGGLYVPDWGQYGGYWHNGGGHSDYGGNESYMLEYGDQCTWIRLDDPSTTFDVDRTYLASNGPAGDPVWTEFTDGQPTSQHGYGRHVLIPPAFGGGPKGTVVRVQGGFYTTVKHGSHKFDLNNPSARWSRWATNVLGDPGNDVLPGSCFDPVRRRIWKVMFAVHAVDYASIDDRTWIRVNQSQVPANQKVANGTAHCHLFYHPVHDRLVYISVFQDSTAGTYEWALSYLNDMENPADGWTRATVSGDAFAKSPTTTKQYQGDADLCTANNRFYLVSGAADAVYEVRIPAVISDPWPVRRIPFSGPAAAVLSWKNAVDYFALGGGYGKKFKQFSYASKLGCYVFPWRVSPFQGDTNPVLAFTPPTD
jgi:hypothetical protein